MKLGIALVALCAALVPGSPAGAEGMKGKIGVGSDASLSGVAGVSGRYAVDDNFGVQAILAVDLYSPKDGDSESTVLLGLGAIYDVIHADQLAVGLRGGVDVAFFSGPEVSPDASSSGTQISLTLALRPELFFSESFSLHAQLGFAVDLLPETGRVVAHDETTGAAVNEGTNIQLAVDLLGTAGFTFWF